MTLLTTYSASTRFGGLKENIFSKDTEMWLMSRDTQHNEISVKAVDHMAGVGIILWRASLRTYELHNLVFSLTWDGGVGNDDFHLSPHGICIQFVCTPISETL